MKQLDESLDMYLYRAPPYLIVGAGMLMAFLFFLALDEIEQVLFPNAVLMTIRFAHLLRGFVATSGGMFFVFWIMSQKEKELVVLRDRFAEELDKRTEQLTITGIALSEEKQRLHTVLSSMGEGVVEVDENGIVSLTNPRAELILGMEHDELLGLNAHVLAERFSTLNPSAGSVNLGQAIGRHDLCLTGEAILYVADNNKRFVSWTSSPINLKSGLLGSVITLADISDRVGLEEQVKLQREDFISALKHKLRTPVLANCRAAKLLLDGSFGQTTESQRSILNLVVENEDKLCGLIDNLVEIYRYQNGIKKLSINNYPVTDILVAVVDKCQGKAEGKKVALEVSSSVKDLCLECDKGEIDELLEELVVNAIDYAKSRVKLHAGFNGRPDEVQFKIEDDGRGVVGEDIRHMFDRFFEVSATGQHPATTGTGLCLCGQIVKAHGGTISCHSNPGEGTTFVVTLPLSQGAATVKADSGNLVSNTQN